VHRARTLPRWSAMTGWIAQATGTALRGISIGGPSLGGAILVSYGLGQIYSPLTWIAAGCFALLADRKMAAERKAK